MKILVMAAGMGTRFGGLKQLAPVGPEGQAVMDYSIHHALQAGFNEAVVVVRSEIEAAVTDHVRASWPAGIAVEVVCQDLDPLAVDIQRRAPRTKPLGTAHAVLVAADRLDGSFAVINADDLYGAESYVLAHRHLTSSADSHCLVGFRLENSFLSSGPVTRGLCVCDSPGSLSRIEESTVSKRPDGAFELERRGGPAETLGAGTLVSMNMWGFQHRVLARVEDALEAFLERPDPDAEVLLPDVVARMVAGGDEVKVLQAPGRCMGVTHPEDLPILRDEVAALVESGVYPRIGRERSRGR